MCVGYICSKELYDLLGPNSKAGDFSEFPDSAKEEFDRMLQEVKTEWGDSYEFQEVILDSYSETGEYVIGFDSVG